jgi:hypothetical protein
VNLDEAVVIRTYASEAVANIAGSRLGFEGIETHIQKDDCGGAYPSLQMCRGVRLLVKPGDREDAERILNEMEEEESGKVEREAEREDPQTKRPSWKPFGITVMKNLPSQQLDELKTFIYTYIVLAPLISALFADKIDNVFVACLLFVGLVGVSFVYVRGRMEELEESLKEQERKLMELGGANDEEFD